MKKEYFYCAYFINKGRIQNIAGIYTSKEKCINLKKVCEHAQKMYNCGGFSEKTIGRNVEAHELSLISFNRI